MVIFVSIFCVNAHEVGASHKSSTIHLTYSNDNRAKIDLAWHVCMAWNYDGPIMTMPMSAGARCEYTLITLFWDKQLTYLVYTQWTVIRVPSRSKNVCI